jgi:AcrR family transcriptional regulator
VLLNQIVLRRYLEETVAPTADGIRDASNDAVRQIEQFAEAHATWLEQISLKDRATFLEEQKALHDAGKVDMEALIDGQNTALRQVVVQTAAVLRAQGPGLAWRPGRRRQARPKDSRLRHRPDTLSNNRKTPGFAGVAVGV